MHYDRPSLLGRNIDHWPTSTGKNNFSFLDDTYKVIVSRLSDCDNGIIEMFQIF